LQKVYGPGRWRKLKGMATVAQYVVCVKNEGYSAAILNMTSASQLGDILWLFSEQFYRRSRRFSPPKSGFSTESSIWICSRHESRPFSPNCGACFNN
jgi:hypothetical protein